MELPRLPAGQDKKQPGQVAVACAQLLHGCHVPDSKCIGGYLVPLLFVNDFVLKNYAYVDSTSDLFDGQQST